MISQREAEDTTSDGLARDAHVKSRDPSRNIVTHHCSIEGTTRDIKFLRRKTISAEHAQSRGTSRLRVARQACRHGNAFNA